MKNKVSKQFLSVLLAFVMIIGLIPTSSVTVFPHIFIPMQYPLGIIAELHRNNLCEHRRERCNFIALAGQRVYIVFGNPNPFCKLTLGNLLFINDLI